MSKIHETAIVSKKAKLSKGVMIGPYDLSASMGLTEQFDDPEFTTIMATIQSKTEFAGIP